MQSHQVPTLLLKNFPHHQNVFPVHYKAYQWLDKWQNLKSISPRAQQEISESVANSSNRFWGRALDEIKFDAV